MTLVCNEVLNLMGITGAVFDLTIIMVLLGLVK